MACGLGGYVAVTGTLYFTGAFALLRLEEQRKTDMKLQVSVAPDGASAVGMHAPEAGRIECLLPLSKGSRP